MMGEPRVRDVAKEVPCNPVSRRRTAFTYDEKFALHACPWNSQHIENPARIRRSFELCSELGLVSRCLWVRGRQAEHEELTTVHSPAYVQLVAICQAKNVDQLKELCLRFDDAYLCSESYDVASCAVGSLLEVLDAVMSRRCVNAFALLRPPGHHALPDQANGFSVFNNVAIACKVALKKYNLRRVLVVDFDVHHGQGVQRTFYNSPAVMYISIHRYEYGLFWPHLQESNWNYFGEGDGFGYNINIPLNKVDLGDAEYLAIFNHLILPLAVEFSPELIFVCAGYDAAVGCPDGHMKVSPETYGYLMQMLCSVAAGGHVVASLEGGYCIDSLAYSVALSVRALLRDPCLPLPSTENRKVDPSVVKVMLNVASKLRSKWRSMDSFMLTVDGCLRRVKQVVFAPSEPVYKFCAEAWSPSCCYVSAPTNPEQLRAAVGRLVKALPEFVQKMELKKKLWIGIAFAVPGFEPDLTGTTNVGYEGSALAAFDAFRSLLPDEDMEDDPLFSYSFFRQTDFKASLNDWLVKYEASTTYSVASETGEAQPEISKLENAKAALSLLDAACHGTIDCGICITVTGSDSAHLNHRSLLSVSTRYVLENFHHRIMVVSMTSGHHLEPPMVFGERDNKCLFVNIRLPAIAGRPQAGDRFGEGYVDISTPCSRSAVCLNFSNGEHSDQDFIYVLQQLIMPLAYSFAPTAAILAVELDTHRCVKGHPWCPTAECVAFYVSNLCTVACGRVAVLMQISSEEQGQAPQSLQDYVNAAVLAGFRGEPTKFSLLSTDGPCHRCTVHDDTILAVCQAVLQLRAFHPALQSVFVPVSLTQNLVDESLCSSASAADADDYTMVFSVSPLPDCEHVPTVTDAVEERIDPDSPCKLCDNVGENWTCLVCYETFCGRYVNQHGLFHFQTTSHALALSLTDLSVWCYACDAYVHNARFLPAKRILHLKKFGLEPPGEPFALTV